MKCVCGQELEGKFCIYCGRKAEFNNEDNVTHYNQYPNMYYQNQQTYNNIPIENTNVNNTIKGAVSEYKKFRFSWIWLGAIVSAICFFAMGSKLAGILLTIGGILLMPLTKKLVKHKKVVTVFAVVFIICGIIEAFCYMDDQEYKKAIIEYVQQYQEPGTYCSIGKSFEYFEEAGYKCTWSYKEEDGCDFVTVSFSDELTQYKVIILIDHYPELYDVTLDGKSDDSCFEYFNEHLFGIESY